MSYFFDPETGCYKLLIIRSLIFLVREIGGYKVEKFSNLPKNGWLLSLRGFCVRPFNQIAQNFLEFSLAVFGAQFLCFSVLKFFVPRLLFSTMKI